MNVRKGQGGPKLDRGAFSKRFRERFSDPAFEVAADAIARMEEIAWEAYRESRKAPVTRLAGDEFSDPKVRLSVEWLATRARLREASRRQKDPAQPSRVLVVCAAARNDATCPGEMSKSFRLASIASDTLRQLGAEIDLLDLSLLSSEYGRTIHPCKGCVSTAMPLCHWPCSCYPNHSLGQVNDWMAEIYERWVTAHGVLIVTPVYWYQAPSGLKLMIDRLVCADGGNPDPTTTHGKHAAEAKTLELRGWDYPKHLAGRGFGLVVHGDAAGAEGLRRGLTDWLETMGLFAAGGTGTLDRYIGYYESYAESHEALDRDEAVQEEVRNVARALARLVADLRQGTHRAPDHGLVSPRPK